MSELYIEQFILEDEALTFLRNVGNTYPAWQNHIPEDQNPQNPRRHAQNVRNMIRTANDTNRCIHSELNGITI